MKRIFSFVIAILIAVTLFPSFNTEVANAASINMNGVASYNNGVIAVPAPGEVTIDGDLSEWDRSGRIHMFNNYEAREQFNNEWGIMWDTEYIYMYNSVSDETPGINFSDPVLEHARSWLGDNLQLRIKSDRCLWLDVSHHHKDDRRLLALDYWHTMSAPKNGEGRSEVNYVTEPGGTQVILEPSISVMSYAKDGNVCEIAYSEHEDGKGYILEYKIRWDIIYNSVPDIVPGLVLNIGMDTNFGMEGKMGRILSYQDNLIPGKYPSGFFCNDSEAWGTVTLSGVGNIEERQYVTEQALDYGSIPVDIEVPKNATMATIVMDDMNGNRICTLTAEMDITDNVVVAETATTKTIRYLWDGKNPHTGLYVSAGKYKISALAHEGLTVKYDTHFYNPGAIPWGTGNTEGWLSDHCSPVAIAAGGGYIYPGALMCEGGSALMKITEDGGEKIWGNVRGVRHMEYYDGYLYCINGDSTWLGNAATGDGYVMKVNTENATSEPFVDEKGNPRAMDYPFSKIFGMYNNTGIIPNTKGIAVSDGKIYISMSAVNKNVQSGLAEEYLECINVLDIETLKLLKRIPLDGAGKLTADHETGRVYAVTTGGIAEVNYNTGKTTKLNLKGVPDDFAPSAVTVDDLGNIVVFDNGSDKQIKAFNPDTGILQYTAAQKGGRPLEGKWEEQGLTRYVSDMDVDSQGRIWVVEDLNFPRRISVWGKDGKLVTDYIGPTHYTGHGSHIHSQNPNLGYYGPVEMSLNREDNTYKVERILWLPDDVILRGEDTTYAYNTTVLDVDPTLEMFTGAKISQYFSSDISGEMHNYAFIPFDPTDDVNGDSNCNVAIFMEREDGLYYPVFALSSASGLGLRGLPDTTDAKKAGGNFYSKDTPMLWNDQNADGRIQVMECEVIPSYTTSDYFEYIQGYWGNLIDENTFQFVRGGSSTTGSGYMYTPAYFKEDGAPVYTKDKSIKALNLKYDGSADTVYYNSNVLYFDDEGKQHMFMFGRTAISSYNITDNKLDWSYPNNDMGVHGSQKAPMPSKGYVLGALKIMGVADTEAGRVFAIRGNNGEDYYFHEDGYYIEAVFEDLRVSRTTLGGSIEEMKKMTLEDTITNGTEPWCGRLVSHDDGKVRVTLAAHSQVGVMAEVTGFDKMTITEPFVMNVTQKMLDDAEAYRHYVDELAASLANEEEEEVKVSTYTIKKIEADAITLDGQTADWNDISSLRIEGEGVAEFATTRMAYDGENLYAMFDIYDLTPMVNGAKEYQTLFKGGDVADIQISPAHNKQVKPVDLDGRLMISIFNGEPVVVLDRTLSSRAPKSSEYIYASPVAALTHEEVVILDDAEVVINKLPQSAVVEVKIPLETIGLDGAESGKEIGGDIGIITSDPEGKRNNARLYYWNKDTALVADMPMESVIYPNKWGTFRFE